jgi:hypothetical protein
MNATGRSRQRDRRDRRDVATAWTVGDGPRERPGTADGVPVQSTAVDDPDLDAIERDLAGVEAALDHLADGRVPTEEQLGSPMTEPVLDAADPAHRISDR